MILADWFDSERIQVPLAVETLEGALGVLLRHGPPGLFGDDAARAKCARDIAFGTRGDVVRIGDEAVLVLATEEGLDDPVAFLGVSLNPFLVTAEGRDDAGQARAVMLVLTPARPESLRARLVPVLRRFLATGEGRLALYAARSAEEVTEESGLLSLELADRTGIASAVAATPHRVYPDTPVQEIYELMTREGLHAVPVVGDDDEVLGVISSGDALRHLVPHARRGPDAMASVSGDLARDVMTRSVMCVSEDQALEDVAALMVNRDVEQLPVVRDGELVGFITRDAVLRSLLGAGSSEGDA